MKFWSEVDGCYIEAEALNFTGPRATVTLVDGTGWQQRYPPVVGTRQTGEYPTQADMRGKGTADVPFGADVFPRSRPHVASPLCACGRAIRIAEARRGVKRCRVCRRSHRRMKAQQAVITYRRRMGVIDAAHTD